MFRWKDSEARLQRYAFHLAGPDAVFKVHYWGASERLQSNPYHKHSFFEICYVLDGEGTYQDHDIVYPVRKGTHFCSRPGVFHQILTTKGLSLLFVAFEIDESSSKEPFVTGFRGLADQGAVVVQEGDALPSALLWKSLLLPDGDAYGLPEAALPVAAHALILSFLTLFGTAAPKLPKPPRNSDSLLNQAKLYISDNLSEPLSLSKVAAYMNISERHLSRLFSTGIHESFTSHLRSERVRHAANLLMHTEHTIKEIADMAGFGSVHYFTRTFHSLMKTTPAKFREQSKR